LEVHGWLSRDRIALLLALLAPLVVSALLVPLRDHLANTQLALVLVLVVVAVAASGNRAAGILAAVFAGVWFDFFLTLPYQRFTITDRSDIETFVLLVVVGVAVTELAVWGRRQQALASREAG
jgi:K+-sensing histidine kinase KdpD